MPVFMDGTGSDRAAGVSADLKGKVLAVKDSGIATASLRGDAYSWTAITGDIDAGDTCIFLRNDDPSRLLVLDRVFLWSDVANKMVLHTTLTGLTADGTAVVAVNLNASSNKRPKATCTFDETTNTIASIIANVFVPDGSALQGTMVELNGSVVLGYDQAFAVDATSEPAENYVWVWGYYIDAA